ncbi:MAG: hypothetical protein EPN30_11480 [Actinomycetota bacterium]|nr:MAG: hypothetical protein EPN30_11480 [Actinomycetota bacterium]
MATIRKTRSSGTGAVEILSKDPDLLKEIIQTAIQELLETEMIEAIGAKKGERTELRLGYRAGYYPRSLGKLCRSDGRPYAILVTSSVQFSMAADKRRPHLVQEEAS